MSRLWKRLADVLDDVLAYILTIIGIVLSNYLPAIKSGDPFSVDVSPWRLASSAVVALLLVAKQESLGDVKDPEVRDRSREGRRRRFWTRMSSAIAQGFMWAEFSNL